MIADRLTAPKEETTYWLSIYKHKRVNNTVKYLERLSRSDDGTFPYVQSHKEVVKALNTTAPVVLICAVRISQRDYEERLHYIKQRSIEDGKLEIRNRE